MRVRSSDASVDYQEALQELADLLVGSISDWCVVDVLEPGQPATRVAVAHADPAKRGLAEEIQRRYPTDPEAPGGVHDVIRTGIPTVVTEVSEDALRAAARDDEHFRLLQQVDIGSAIIVPLRARGEVFGALTLVGSSGRHRYTDADLPLIEELAGRAATAVDNARLLHEANEAVRLRDDFLAMASHDMRTPLAVILANLQLARRRLVGQDARAWRGLQEPGRRRTDHAEADRAGRRADGHQHPAQRPGAAIEPRAG